MTPLLVILSQSNSFSELWPKLASAVGARLQVAASVAELGGLDGVCGVIVAAGGVEEGVVGLMEALRANRPTEIVVAGVETDHRLVASLLRGRTGADDYFALPGDLGVLRAWALERVEHEVRATRGQAPAAAERKQYDFSRLIGRSPCLFMALDRAAKMIPRKTTILISGETGTGKGVLARAIHENGPRAAKPFIGINCAALPETLLETELFGYEPGAFTDARGTKPGLFEAGNGGTLFLDEIGDLSLGLQGKLLRVLEDKRVRRLGGLEDKEVDVRFIAATNVDLRMAMSEGYFRQDLYYRLSVVPIQLPALRDRGEDVLLLTEYFLDLFSTRHELPRPELTSEVRHALLTHPFPGNVRELSNAVERAVLLDESTLVPGHFVDGSPDHGPSSASIPFPASMEAIQCAAARAMVNRFDGNKSGAARALGVSRKYLYTLLNGGNVQ